MIVVTGGAGFIGSNIIKGLNKQGIDDIIVVDNLSNSQKHLNLNSLNITDYLDKEELILNLQKIKNVKTIFHQGACSSTTESDGKYMMKNNYEYSKQLLHYAMEKNIDFLYASSASVYGDGHKGFREDRAYEYPLNVYAFSKFAFDNYVRPFLSIAQSQILGLRYFNVYGYQENHKGSMASVGFHMFNQLQTENKMKLFEGSENFRRDFVFVEDVVDVNLFFYEKKLNGIFNCGTGKARSFLDIATTLRKVHNGGEIEYIPFPEHLKGKYQAFTQADLNNLRAIGYTKEFHSLEQGLEKYYNNLSKTGGYLI